MYTYIHLTSAQEPLDVHPLPVGVLLVMYFVLLAKLRDEHPRKQLHHHPQQGVYSLHQENLRAQGQCAETTFGDVI